MADTANADVKALPFEKALAELETIVQKLERGDVPLEESVAIYERGEALKRRCEELIATDSSSGTNRLRSTSAAKRSSAAARSCCGRPRRGSTRSPSTRRASRPA